MNCNDFKECACEVVDKRLSEDKTREVLQHATVCPHCQYELNALATSKKIVHDKIHRVSVPTDLYYAILRKTVHRPGFSFFGRFFGFAINPAITMVALIVVIVGAYSLLFPTATISDDANIIQQSLNNYQAVIGGGITPQFISSNDNVRSFLEKEVPFAVNVPKMKNCSTCAGVLSSFNGVKLAHVVYKVGDNIIYIYQADMDEAMKGEKIGLPAEAKTELLKTDWYIQENSDGRTIVLWKYKNTLCAAVSGMSKSELMALITDKEQQ